jgi:transcriptional regulator with XRE-family HTH domain
VNNYSSVLFDAAQVFPDSHPGRVLRGLRTREDLTQAELASKSGLKPHHISEMENAKRPIGKEVARRLAKALNADFRMLL